MNKNYSGNNPYAKDEKEERMKEYEKNIDEIMEDFKKVIKFFDKSFIDTLSINIKSFSNLQKFVFFIGELNWFAKFIDMDKKYFSILELHDKLNSMKLSLSELYNKNAFINCDTNIKIQIKDFLDYLENSVEKCNQYKFNPDTFYEEVTRINKCYDDAPDYKRDKFHKLTFKVLEEMGYSKGIEQIRKTMSLQEVKHE